MVLNCCWPIIGLLLLLGQMTPFVHAALPDSVQVHLFEAYPAPAQVYLSGPFDLQSPVMHRFTRGRYVVWAQNHRLALRPEATSQQDTPLSGNRLLFHEIGNQPISITYPGLAPRHYHGELEITLEGHSRLFLRNRVATKDYVMSVVGSETLPQWPLEALKAQAVLSQTWLVRHAGLKALGDSTQQQTYLGADTVCPDIQEAVSSVWQEILTYHHHPILAFYHSTCAGGTSSGNYLGVNLSNAPYLRPVPCHGCKKSPFWGVHTSTISSARFQAVFGPGMPRVTQLDTSGRPTRIAWSHGEGMSGYQFWMKLGQSFGWDKVPGSRYQILTTSPGAVMLTSTGAGHGVGLCQWGAAEQARRGKLYTAILQYYFPGTMLEKQ
jgi:stage II sporulation protein D